mgnify:CR=1 FL=1
MCVLSFLRALQLNPLLTISFGYQPFQSRACPKSQFSIRRTEPAPSRQQRYLEWAYQPLARDQGIARFLPWRLAMYMASSA